MSNIKIKDILSNIRNIFSKRIIFWICISVGIILLVNYFLNLVVVLGHHVPVRSIRIEYTFANKVLSGWRYFSVQWLKIDYIYGLFWGIILGLSIFIWPIRQKDKKAVFIAWCIKLFVVLFLMLFYEWHYYCLDSYGYYNATFYNRSEWPFMSIQGSIFAMVNLIWLQQQIIPSFHAVKVSFAMLGLVAIYIFYRGIVIFLKQEKISLFYILVFFPSILFWSSILGKDPISFLGMALYVYGAIGWYCRRKRLYLLILILGLLVSIYIRAWLGLILLVPFIALFFLGLKKSGKIWFLLSVTGFIVLFKNMLIKFFQPQSLDKLVKTANQMSYGFDAGGSALRSHEHFSDIIQMLFYIPRGMFTALFRPLPGEVHNLFGFLAGIENILILIILLFAIRKLRWADLKEPLFIWAILLILAWGSVYSFLAYNLGTISRYRFQIMPILLILILYPFRKRHVTEKG
ncbi:MAG: hypothetical protein PHC29_04515 [Candidatus Omnitrophica bacterium]|nr:hypothetical protein [Candidatus Omnitrophota bacterium]